MREENYWDENMHLSDMTFVLELIWIRQSLLRDMPKI